MALTLLEAAKKMTGQDFRQAIIEIFASSHPLLVALPFEDIPGDSTSFNREGTLPGTAFRAINGSYTASEGKLDPVTEKLFISGGDLDVDRFILKTRGEGQRNVQEQMKAKALAHNWAHKFIKGDNQSSPLEFDGLQARCVGNQLVANGATSGGDVLSLAKLDEAIKQTLGATHLLMSQSLDLRFSATMRSATLAGNINQTRDQFGQPLREYNGLPILTMDDPDQLNATLAFDEANPGGGSSVGTSIYVVGFGPNRLTGIQKGAPDAEDLGELQTKPVFRTRLEWYAGISQWHRRSATRLWGIKAGAIAA